MNEPRGAWGGLYRRRGRWPPALRVGEYSRHDRDTSMINDHQSALESCADPLHSTKLFVDP
jgi:hypothetical protein